MNAGKRRTLLTILVFGGVLSIGPFIAPTPHLEIVSAAELHGSEGASISSGGAAADIVSDQLKDATGVPELARIVHRLLLVALATFVLGIALAAPTRPVARGPVRFRRPGVGLLPDRRGPPSLSV